MQNPSTPQKPNDEIERLKQSLSAKWGILLPPRDNSWSPSRQNRNLPEEIISNRIQFLYFRQEGALRYAIDEFEKKAVTIYTQWQFKPRGDSDVIPINNLFKDSVKGTLLRKREELPEVAIKELTNSLLDHLSQVRDQVKNGATFPIKQEQVGDHSEVTHVETKPAATPSIEEYRPIATDESRRQSSLKQWFGNKSAPGASIAHTNTSPHPSSDDFSDPELTEIFANPRLMDVSHHHPDIPSPASYKQPPIGRPMLTNYDWPTHGVEAMSPSDEKFETPPTTPPHRTDCNIGLGLGLEEQSTIGKSNAAFSLQQHELSLNKTKKRPYPDSEPMKPPPSRKVSRETRIDRPNMVYTVPTPPPDSYSLMSRSFSSSRSFDNISSVSSSFTGASPAWTSPNTSFCSDSVTTSFDSSADETDTTIRPSVAQIRSKQPRERSPPWLGHRPSASDHDDAHMYDSQSRRWNDPPVMLVDRHVPYQPHRIYDISKVVETSVPPTKAITCPFVEFSLSERLISHPPSGMDASIGTSAESLPNFQDPSLNQPPKVSFRQLYEVFRVSASCAVPITAFSECLDHDFESYSQLWNTLTMVVAKIKSIPLPERSSLTAWNRAGDKFEGVSLSGSLKFLDQPVGPVFKMSLLPLKIESSYRLARKYRHDRFCVMLLPSLNSESFPYYLRSNHAAAREIIIKWLVETEHVFLGRKWRAFYVKPEPTKKSQKGVKADPNDAKFRVHLFAEDGEGFQREDTTGEVDPRRPHSRVTIKQLIDWFMPSELNGDQPALKLFSRLGMGLTNTIPTLTFFQREIVRSDDARSDAPGVRRLNIVHSERLKTDRDAQVSKAAVMNDGCARISRDAAVAIANLLGLVQVPSVFQGRIGGAKGVWMVDVLDERPNGFARLDGQIYWIEITDSQLKFKPHATDALFPDDARVTFEVNKYSKPLSPSSLNFQLMPILEKRGVPQVVFKKLLKEDLSSRVSEMEVAMDDGLALRKWNQDTNSVSHERAQYGGIEMVGGLPESTAEIINWFVEVSHHPQDKDVTADLFQHGFEPKSCLFLKNQLWNSIRNYCLRLENRMNIGLGRSTMAYMIADPLAILEEGEVHIGFSNMFRDAKSGFNENMLHDTDVLVARLPAHLPSDIQKVHAVFKPELRLYRDIVVFSSKGDVSLASKLSGGDYDGDTAWICWDPEIVDPFRNAAVPEHPTLETYGIEKDYTKVSELLPLNADYTNRFLLHAFNFNMQMNMLGICTKYHEALCYRQDTIESLPAIHIAVLLGNLVDSAKGGFKYDDARWTEYLTRLGLPRNLEPPAYKDKLRARERKDNLIDQLVFHIAKEERQTALKNFTQHFQNVGPWDEDLVSLRRNELEEAKSNKALAGVLNHLKTDLGSILAYWKTHAKREDDEEDLPPPRRSNALSFRSVVEKCREDFLVIKPKPDKDHIVQLPNTIYRWQRHHSEAESSYWDLLKASVAFYHFYKSVSFIWHIAGVELGEIKATRQGRGTYRPVVNRLHHTLKIDGKLVDGAKKRELQMEELRKVEADDEDQYGSDVDMSDL